MFLWPVTKHKGIANPWENVFRPQSARVGFELIKIKTLVIFQVVIYLGKADLILKTLLRSLHTQGDLPSLKEFSQEFFSHLSSCLNGIDVPFTTKFDKPFDMGIVPFSYSHSPWSW